MSRWARKVDLSDPAITDTLRRLGFAVRDLSRQGGGCPDKIAALPDGRLWLIEMKTPGTWRGRQFTPSQKKWREGWPVPVVVLRTVDEATAWAIQQRADTGPAAAGLF